MSPRRRIAVRALAGWKASTDTSASVTSIGVPKVAIVLKNASSPPALQRAACREVVPRPGFCIDVDAHVAMQGLGRWAEGPASL
jgi:hypothetical protein